MEGLRLFQMCAFTVILLSTDTQGSIIKFEAYPNVLKANLTSSASMRCSLSDTDITGSQIGKRSISSTAEDISHIHAIYITRNGENVASVTSYDAPIAETDLGNLEVKGDLTGTSSQGYLELTWKNPSAMAMGEYNCEINTITETHHSVLFTSTLEMTEVAPTVNDVIAELKDLKQKQTNFEQQQTIFQQKQTNFEQQQTISQQEQTKLKQQQATLKECASRRAGFMAVISANFNGNSKVVAQDQAVVFDKVIYSVGGNYDQTNGIFTCSEPGLYSFTIHSLGQKQTGLNLKLNSNTITSSYSYGAGTTIVTGAASALIHLNKSDILQVTVDIYGANFYQAINIFQGNTFVGHMVQSDCVI